MTTIAELIADCPIPPGHECESRLLLRLTLRHFADHIYDVTLSSGVRVLDPSDFKRFFEECVEQMNPLQRAPSMSWKSDPVCGDCDHVHESRDECGKYLGEGKFCRCESKVTA